MNDIFPPQFYTYGSEVVAGMNTKEMNQEVDSLVKKYTQGSKYAQKQVSNRRISEEKQNALMQEEMRLQKELALAKQDIDAINKEVEKNMQANMARAKSNQEQSRPARTQNASINIDIPTSGDKPQAAVTPILEENSVEVE